MFARARLITLFALTVLSIFTFVDANPFTNKRTNTVEETTSSTNAQRFARGLGPLPPTRRFDSTRVGEFHHTESPLSNSQSSCFSPCSSFGCSWRDVRDFIVSQTVFSPFLNPVRVVSFASMMLSQTMLLAGFHPTFNLSIHCPTRSSFPLRKPHPAATQISSFQ